MGHGEIFRKKYYNPIFSYQQWVVRFKNIIEPDLGYVNLIRLPVIYYMFKSGFVIE